jgi:pimeloyl-ACP methyl ester carboxylesterase
MGYPKRVAVGLLGTFLLLSACQKASVTEESAALKEGDGSVTKRDIDFKVTIRETGSVTIHATVYENPRSRIGINVLAIHGLSETGNCYGPLAQAIFAEKYHLDVKRVIAIDLPGHGDSSYPTNLPGGLKFGELTIEDNVAVVIQSIEALRAQRLPPRVIIGHSMGGLAVQAVQQTLLSKRSSLAAQGIISAILLAPVPTHGQTWTRNPDGGDMSQFVVADPALGNYVALPAPVWIASAFSTTAGTTAPNAPSPQQVADNNYIGVEPLTTLLQLTEATVPLPTGETLTLQRPSVNEAIFSLIHGTRLTVVSFSEDILVPAADLDDLYAYLTGDRANIFYRPVVATDAVHSMFISNPAEVAKMLRGAL